MKPNITRCSFSDVLRSEHLQEKIINYHRQPARLKFLVALSLVTIVSFAAPIAAQGFGAALTGFSDSAGEHVYYLGVDSHVHQLYWNGSQELDQDLTLSAGGPAVTVTSPSFTSFSNASGQHVYYVGDDSHVHQLYWNGSAEVDQDLTADTAGATAAISRWLTSFSDAAGEHVYYVAVHDFHVHQLYWNGHQEVDQDLTTLANGVGACSLTGFSNASGQHVYYVGCLDSQVHQLYWNGRQEVDQDLTAVARGAQASIDVGLASFSNTAGEHVYYVDRSRGHIHQLYWNGHQEFDQDLTASARGPLAAGSDLTAFSNAAGEHVYYIAAFDAHVHQLWWNGHAEIDQNLASVSGSTGGCFFGRLTSFSNAAGEHVYYISDDAHVHQLYWNGSQEFNQDLTEQTGGVLAGSCSALQ